MVFEHAGRAELRTYPIRYWPFRHEDLLARPAAAGFSCIASDHEQPDDDRYRVAARRA